MQAPLPTRRHRERICYDRSRAGRASGSAAHFCKSSRDSGGAGNESKKERWCGRGDSNPHGLATVSPSSWCVCQFRHFRT